jgi:hypothetical protein
MGHPENRLQHPRRARGQRPIAEEIAALDGSMHGWKFGKAELGAGQEGFSWRAGKKTKKEEFPGIMENMLPGNSFPQICVVSVNKSVGNESEKRGQYCSLPRSQREHDPK